MAICVGVDPGHHTGIAVWDTSTRQFIEIRTTGIVSAMDYLTELHKEKKIMLLVFEDARQRTWIPRERDIRQVKGRAMGAGSVKRDCSIWEEWCSARGIQFIASRPKTGMTKLTDAYFRGITGYDRRTNEHGRDAAMLVFQR
jgi:hypothetical protein